MHDLPPFRVCLELCLGCLVCLGPVTIGHCQFLALSRDLIPATEEAAREIIGRSQNTLSDISHNSDILYRAATEDTPSDWPGFRD